MKRSWSPRHLAVAAAAVFLGCQRALALPQAHETVQPAPSPWVTVNAAGVGITLTPQVITSNGVTTTQNPPPGSLTSTATYTISPNGRASTYTGLAPIATATATGGNSAGAFLACTQYQSSIAPFCAPQNGAVLYQGLTYYITWNPGWFSNPDVYLEVQGLYNDVGLGMTSGIRITASMGFFAWGIPANFLSSLNHTSLNLTFQFAKEAEETDMENDFEPILGPTVLIVSGSPPVLGAGGPPKNSPNTVAIAVPVVVGVVLVLIAGLSFWSWRRHGSVPFVGMLGKARRSSGYGVRQSQSERVGARVVGASDKAGPNVGIQLTDRDSWSPTGTGNSRNVFREELQRQERQR